MKKLKLFGSMILCIALFSVLFGCGGGTNPTSAPSVSKQGVAFSFAKNVPLVAKTVNKTVSATVPTTLDATARYALVTLTDGSGSTKDYQIEIYSLNGSYITATLQLDTGNYTLTRFAVLDSNNSILYLVPTQSADADLKALVSTVLPAAFTVTTGQTNTISVEVVAPGDATASAFGYPSGPFTVVSYIKFASSIQIWDNATQSYKPTDGKLTVNNVEYSHPNTTVTLRVKQAESYTVVVSKDGYGTETIVLSAAEMANYQTAPLVVTLNPLGTLLEWTGPQIVIDGSLRSSPYLVPAGRNNMTIRISGGAGGNGGNLGELRTFTGVPISSSTYTIVVGQAGEDGGVIDNNAGGGGGGGGASTIKLNGTYIAGAAGGNGGDGCSGIDHESSPGGAGGGGDGSGSAGGDSNTYSDQGPGLGGPGGEVNTGGLPVGGTITGSGNGVLEITTY